MSQRLLNSDGSFNIYHKKRPGLVFSDLYHFLLSLSWPRLILILVGVFLIAHFFFASLYYLCGPSSLQGLGAEEGLDFYLDCFFFSVQTLATIGYGHIAPRGFWPNVLVTFESFLGLFGLALMTGLLFARFSRPNSRVIFSRVALMTHYQNQPVWMFRIANERMNQIVEAKVSVIVVKDEAAQDGKVFRKVYNMKLLRETTPIFALSWTVVHPITPDSPIYGLNAEDFEKGSAEIFVSVTGIDEVFSQTIHARYSYVGNDILWNKQFKDVLIPSERGIEVDLAPFHEVE